MRSRLVWGCWAANIAAWWLTVANVLSWYTSFVLSFAASSLMLVGFVSEREQAKALLERSKDAEAGS